MVQNLHRSIRSGNIFLSISSVIWYVHTYTYTTNNNDSGSTSSSRCLVRWNFLRRDVVTLFLHPSSIRLAALLYIHIHIHTHTCTSTYKQTSDSTHALVEKATSSKIVGHFYHGVTRWAWTYSDRFSLTNSWLQYLLTTSKHLKYP